MSESAYQVDGDHYEGSHQWWDLSTDMQIANPLIHTALKYIDRYSKKGSVRPITLDIEKAIHYIKKYQELVKEKRITRFSRCYYNPRKPLIYRRYEWEVARYHFMEKMYTDTWRRHHAYLLIGKKIRDAYSDEDNPVKWLRQERGQSNDVFEREFWHKLGVEYRENMMQAIEYILDGDLDYAVKYLEFALQNETQVIQLRNEFLLKEDFLK